MASAPQWRNVQAPAFAAANSLRNSSANAISGGIQNFSDVLMNEADRRSGIRTEEGKAQIAGIQNLDQFDTRLQGILGQYDAAGSDLGALVDFGNQRQQDLQGNFKFNATKEEIDRNKTARDNVQGASQLINSMVNDPNTQYSERDLRNALSTYGQENKLSPESLNAGRALIGDYFTNTVEEAANIKKANDYSAFMQEIQKAQIASALKMREQKANEQNKSRFGNGTIGKDGRSSSSKTVTDRVWGSDSLQKYKKDETDAKLTTLQALTAKQSTRYGQSTYPYTDSQGNVQQIPASSKEVTNAIVEYLNSADYGRFEFRDVPGAEQEFVTAIGKILARKYVLPKNKSNGSAGDAAAQLINSLKKPQ